MLHFLLNKLRKLRWHALSRLFALSASVFSLLIYWIHPILLDRVDTLSRDLVFQLRSAPAPDPRVLIVAVDEQSIKQYGRWPWPRELQGELIAAIKARGVKTIALDIVYLKSQSPEQDASLAEALATSGAPVVGGYFFRDKQTLPPDSQALALVSQSQIKLVSTGPAALKNTVPIYSFIEVNQKDLAARFQSFGFFNYMPDADGTVRSTPMILRYQDGFYPSLALAALAEFQGTPPSVLFDIEGVSVLQLGDRHIPVDQLGRLTLNFYSHQTAVPIISAADVLHGNIPTQTLTDKLVFVGVTEIGIADIRPTPVDSSFPGVAIHATAAANILQSYYLYHDANTVLADVVLVGFAPLLMVSLLAYIRKVFARSVVFAVTIILVWLVFYLAVSQGFLISLVYPLLAIALGFGMFQSYYMLVMLRQANFLQAAFSSYVSPDLVKRLISRPEGLTLTGEKRNISVLFSDIRGFTTLSENMPPETLVPILNRYLGPMTEIVMNEQGTLDKYIGDAVMAFYNAPLDVSHHPIRATRSALHMFDALEEMNRQFQREFALTLDIGIGIHTGDASVGNMGSTQRFDYTAIGDTVNLASRLEGRTKAYGVRIIISETTHARLDDSIICRKLDRIQVKGKSQPIEIYEVMSGVANDEAVDRVRRFESALNEYIAGCFAAALEGFQSLVADYPHDKPAYVFIERCTQNLKEPPSDWNGVYVATDK